MASSLTSVQRKELKDAFDVFDTDGSDKISRKELGNILKVLNIKVNDSQLKKIVAEMDTDRSGHIEFDEFCRVMGESFFKKYSDDELRVAFRQFDRDGSGNIQADELADIMHKMGRRHDKSQIDAIVRSVDTSGDEKVSFDEFVKLF